VKVCCLVTIQVRKASRSSRQAAELLYVLELPQNPQESLQSPHQ